MANVVGRWIPLGSAGIRRPEQPYLQLDSDGSWSASDGCNGQAGRWLLRANGDVTATSGARTAIGCVNEATFLGEVGSLRLVAGKLLLFDGAAELVNTLGPG